MWSLSQLRLGKDRVHLGQVARSLQLLLSASPLVAILVWFDVVSLFFLALPDRHHALSKMLTCIWTTAGFYWMAKDEKTFYMVPEVIYTPLPFLFPLTTCTLINLSSLSFCVYFFPSSFLHSSAPFIGVLEKTVEGEAVALTKAKTLYKSCTNERKSVSNF